MDGSARIVDLLQRGLAAVQEGRKEEAYDLLLQVTELDERNEQAWLWLSGVVDSPEDKRVCMENVLAINPENVYALAGMRWLDEGDPQSAAPPAQGASAAPSNPPPSAPPEAAPSAAPVEPPSPAAAPPPAAGPQERCPACLAPVALSNMACPSCGELLVVFCPSCGEEADVGDLSCPACGVILGDCQDGIGYHLGLAEAYLKAAKPDLAQNILKHAHTVAAGDAARLMTVAGLYAQAGGADQAAGIYRDVIKADAANALAHVRLGALYSAQGDAEKARAECDVAVGAARDDAEILFELARLHMAVHGPSEQVLKWLDRTTRLDRKHAGAHLLLGDVYGGMDEQKKAARHYKRALKLAPPDTEVAREAQGKLGS